MGAPTRADNCKIDWNHEGDPQSAEPILFSATVVVVAPFVSRNWFPHSADRKALTAGEHLSKNSDPRPGRNYPTIAA